VAQVVSAARVKAGPKRAVRVMIVNRRAHLVPRVLAIRVREARLVRPKAVREAR